MKRQRQTLRIGVAVTLAAMAGSAQAAAAPMTKGQTIDASIACDDLATSAAERHKTLVVARVAQCFSDRGQHVLAAERLRAQLQIMERDGTPGGRAALESFFKAESAYIATLDIKTSRDAEVFVDGRMVGKSTDVNAIFVAPGPHVVEARHGTDEARKNINVEAGKTIVVEIPIEPKKVEPPKPVVIVAPSRPTWQVVTMGLGGAVGVSGLILGIVGASAKASAIKDYDQIQDSIPDGASKCENVPALTRCREEADSKAAAERSHGLMVSGFVLGGVGLATVATAFFWPRSSDTAKKNDSGLALTYVPLQGGGGLTLKGVF